MIRAAGSNAQFGHNELNSRDVISVRALRQAVEYDKRRRGEDDRNDALPVAADGGDGRLRGRNSVVAGCKVGSQRGSRWLLLLDIGRRRCWWWSTGT